MKVFAETERFILREVLPGDTAGFFEMDSDPEVHRYLGSKPLATKEQASDIIDFIRRQYMDNGVGRWSIIDKSTGEFVGWTGFKLIRDTINNHRNFYDLGYRLCKKYWGKGIATETGVAALKYGFEQMQLTEVFAMADSDNAGSNKVLVKLGFTPAGKFLYEEIEHNWYELSKEKWDKKK